MRVLLNRTVVRLLLGLVALAATGFVLLSSEDLPQFTKMDKAYYADAQQISFIRPGLYLEILGVTIADDGTVKVRFKMQDRKDTSTSKGMPLDRDGLETAGPVQTRWVIAYLPKDQSKYVAYNFREVSSSISGQKATQATDDGGGRTAANYQKVGAGEYIFTFATKLPANYDKSATHTIGVWGSRNLSEFELDGVANAYSLTYNFVPNGAAVAKTRDVIRSQTCAKCHDVMQAHDSRRTLELCVLCHTPQSTDPDTGNSVDMTVMTHKIHMGEHLTKGYKIIGFGNATHDYGHVALPTEPQNCNMCHEQNTGAAQKDAHLKNPTREACGSCHDNVNFATGENHLNLPQLNDTQCARCHNPEGELEFDASIVGAHTVATRSRDLPGVVFTINEIKDAAPGKKPVVTFTIKNKAGDIIKASQMNRLGIVMAGPTTDYSKYWSEDALKATANADGSNTWTFVNAVPADAKGTFAFGMEGYKNIVLMPGTKQEQTVRDAGVNVVSYASVDGSPLKKRREVVSLAKCNACHGTLYLHGGNRTTIDQCVLCHAPNVTDDAVRPAANKPAESIQMAYMVHRIHMGNRSEAEYTVYGRGSVAYDFSHIGYPSDPRNCSMCHVNGSEQLPLDAGMINVVRPRGPLSPMGPATAACTGCHTEIFTASHALSNTTEKLGEACSSCHATGREFAVDKSHAR